ncbi:MAG: SDR family oxidoreductase [Bryobacterales bacterium]|nr:SDR family oxidoreductase [Bryobacterales bacterium]
MDLKLQDKVALVTGGTKGIGRAIAERLIRAGATVVVCARTPAAIPGAETIEADVADESQVKTMFATILREHGGMDILVNNAGVGLFSKLSELTPAAWHKVIDTNLSGVYYCCHHGLPLIHARGGGFIVNISSLAARNPFAGGAAYNASKFGLNGMTEAMMLDHRYENVRVCTIMPGSVSTEFGRAGKADWKIQPEDVAEAVAMVLAMPERTLISRVEIRPSKPPK